MLMDVYTVDELDKIDDWIEKISNGNKVMETLHAKIHKLKDQTQEQILEAKRQYSNACLDIFEDESRDRIMNIQAVVEKLRKTFEEASTDEDIILGFKTEEALLELDVNWEILQRLA